MPSPPALPLIEPIFVPSSDGVSVAVYDFGGPDASDAPTIFFSHATGFCGGVWQPMASHLLDRYRCVAFDLRGHGRTELPEGVSLDWWGMGSDVVNVVDWIRQNGHDGSRFACGHSMGGCAIAIAEIEQPALFDKMWAFEPILFPVSDDARALGHGGRGNQPERHGSVMVDMALKRRDTFESADAVFDRYVSRPPFSLIDRRALRAYVDYGFRTLDDGSVTLRCTPATEAQVFSNALCGAYERLDELATPYLVAGGGDGQPPADMARQAADAFDQLSFVHYDELNHFGPLQAPERLGDDVAAWFDAV